MFTGSTIGRWKPTRNIRRGLSVGTIAVAMAIVPAGAAQAELYFTKYGAQRVAKGYVSNRYADTYVADLTTVCRPQGRSYSDPRYKYHRWVCGWYDSSDDTSGTVLIVGSSGSGAYYGRVLVGAH
jgi:hypothetical protein